MWFQVALVVALLVIAVYLLRSTPSARHLAIRRLVMLAGLVAGIVAIIWPDLLTTLARLVGVGRGADLLFYLAIVVGLLYAVNEYKRSVRLAQANTQLARELALTDALLRDRIRELETRRDDQD
jgi:small membrane protein